MLRSSPARLAVCIPAYNQPELLRQTLTSLCDQGLSRDEYVVAISDDASPISLADVAAEFDDRLQVVYDRSPENIGHLQNWDRASRLVEAPYLSFLSHDDVVSPGHLRRAMDAMTARPGAVLAASLVLVQRHPGALDTYLHGTFLNAAKASFIEPYLWDRTEWMALALTGTPLSIVGAIFQAAAFRQCTRWREFPLWHDRLMLGEMGLHGAVISLPWIAGHYRVGASQLSGKLWDNDRTEFKAATQAVLELSEGARIPVIDFWIQYICDTTPERRTPYLRILHTALSTKQFTDLRRACETRLQARLPLTRLERLRVPDVVASFVRELDRALAGKAR
jgi:glycosyltransferase involved in cell wall biosynthesis